MHKFTALELRYDGPFPARHREWALLGSPTQHRPLAGSGVALYTRLAADTRSEIAHLRGQPTADNATQVRRLTQLVHRLRINRNAGLRGQYLPAKATHCK